MEQKPDNAPWVQTEDYIPRPMNIYAPSGTQVRPIMREGRIANGWNADNARANRYLSDQVYTVEKIEVHSSHTRVYLEELSPHIWINSVCLIEEIGKPRNPLLIIAEKAFILGYFNRPDPPASFVDDIADGKLQEAWDRCKPVLFPDKKEE